MARAAFFCFPADGHINPTLPLVEELVRRGEQVDFFCTQRFRTVIERAGARYRAVPECFDQLDMFDVVSEGMFMLSEQMAKVTLEGLGAFLEALERDKPDYVFHDMMAPWGRLIAQKLRLPAIATSPMTLALDPERVPQALLLLLDIRRFAHNLRCLRRRRELSREIARRFGVDELTFGGTFATPEPCTLVFTSERLSTRRETLDGRFSFVGATLAEPPDPSFPIQALEGRRVVYASMGTVFNSQAEVFRACLATFNRDDEIVVIGAGKRVDLAQLGPLPANCIVRPHVPQLAVLSRAALIVSHGGMNSVNGALYHRVPMLIYPQGADNFHNAKRVVELGVGRQLRARDLDPRRLRKLADEMMTDARAHQTLKELSVSLRTAGGAGRAADLALAFRDRSLPCA